MPHRKPSGEFMGHRKPQFSVNIFRIFKLMIFSARETYHKKENDDLYLVILILETNIRVDVSDDILIDKLIIDFPVYM